MRRSGIMAVFIFGVIYSNSALAQYAGEAFRFSEINQTGTARFQGIGGNHAALGGDASAISGNPAGLGFYNRSEISISPALTNINTKSSYIDQITTDGKSNFNIANASLVLTSQPGFQRKWKRTSLGISFSRQQSFQNAFRYSGRNNRSAYVDKVVEDANGVGWTDSQYEDELNANEGAIQFPDHAYYQLQMIYPTSFVNQDEGYGPPYTRDDRTNATMQDGGFNSKGANTQFSVAYGGNYNDKLYVGGSVGFTRIRYSYVDTLRDTFINPTIFNYSTRSEDLTVTGNGANVNFGVIYKLSPLVQLGVTLTSPTYMVIKESFNQRAYADYIPGSIRNDQGQDVGPTESSIALVPNDFQYRVTSPFRGSAGASYFFSDRGFITGTLEYVGYAGLGLRTTYLTSQENTDFKTDSKAEVSDLYRNTVNARIGGEYRAGPFRGRLGLSYLSDPYREQLDGINRQKLQYSIGAGYRNERFFADLSGSVLTYKSAYTPYVLENVQDYSSANISNRAVNVVLTVGTFF